MQSTDSDNPPPNNALTLIGRAFVDAIRQAVREELKAAANGNGHGTTLLTPEQLAKSLSVPVTWVYEQSRQGRIPTHRLGKYLRFDLQEVLASQAAKQATEKN